MSGIPFICHNLAGSALRGCRTEKMHHSDAASNERRVQGTIRVILASKPQDTFSSKLGRGGLVLEGENIFLSVTHQSAGYLSLN